MKLKIKSKLLGPYFWCYEFDYENWNFSNGPLEGDCEDYLEADLETIKKTHIDYVNKYLSYKLSLEFDRNIQYLYFSKILNDLYIDGVISQYSNCEVPKPNLFSCWYQIPFYYSDIHFTYVKD